MRTFSDPWLIIVGTFLLHQAIFWIYNGIILLLTYVIYPERSKKFKIQKVRSVLGNMHEFLLLFLGHHRRLEIRERMCEKRIHQSNVHSLSCTHTLLSDFPTSEYALAYTISTLVEKKALVEFI